MNEQGTFLKVGLEQEKHVSQLENGAAHKFQPPQSLRAVEQSCWSFETGPPHPGESAASNQDTMNKPDP